MRRSLLIAAALAALLALTATRPPVRAAWQRNRAGHALLHGMIAAGGDCTALPGAAAMRARLERAVALQPDSAAAWLMLLRVRGLTDRAWLRGHTAELPTPDTLEVVLAELIPDHMQSAWPWDVNRCNQTWAAWTTALLRAEQGRWDEAVAAYQIGLGLAPGRTPPAIVQEYYRALSQATQVAPQAAAHYLTLAEDAQATAPLAADASHWILSQGAAIERDGYRLLGLDMDQAVLDAGAEVVAMLYWQDAAGHSVQQVLRAANLWPNSGNTWRAAGRFWPCLPGYSEPGWLSACASHSSDATDAANPVGLIRHDPQQSADSYIVTASAPVQAGVDLVVGGRWLMAGDFPAAQVAAQSADNRYGVLLDLSSLPRQQWQAVAGSAGHAATAQEMVWWLRPRSGVGEGDFLFDDVFLFAIPPDWQVAATHG